jgi:hypothetical protein
MVRIGDTIYNPFEVKPKEIACWPCGWSIKKFASLKYAHFGTTLV